jgi:amino acid adenylation domain-containing protein/non-ribosomal peptide synthase protein (TIGR01720 family)
MSVAAGKSELLEAILRQRGIDPLSLAIPPRLAEGGTAPLTFTQERLWVLEQLEPGRPAYNEAYSIRFTGPLSPPALAAALAECARRHAVLRTRFAAPGGRPLQVISPLARLPLPCLDLEALPPERRQAEAARHEGALAARPFDLTQAPLARALLVRLGPGRHCLALTLHHVLCDATSIQILVRELAALHAAAVRGTASPLPEPALQYGDFAAWQRERQAPALDRQLAEWRERLRGAPTVLELPADRPRADNPRGRGAAFETALPAPLSHAVKSLARGEGVTLFMTLLAAFQVLVARWSGRLDFLLGTPIAGRTRPEVQEMVGFFVNTLVLRASLAGNPTFREVLARCRRTVTACFDYQEVPFSRLVEALRPERAAGRAPLVQVVFLLQKPGLRVDPEEGLDFEMQRIPNGASKFDLTFLTRDSGDEIGCGVEYDSDLFLAATMIRLLDRYRLLLAAVTERPDLRVAELDLLTPAERQQLLIECNDTARGLPRHACIHELIAMQAARTPGAPAVISDERTLTYEELMAGARRFARRLRRLGVRTDDLVALLLPPSTDLLIVVLGVLEAGGGYLPLDAEQPPERLAWLLADAGPRVVVAASRAELPGTPAAATLVLDEERDALARLSADPLEPWAAPESLAYQIYTSGSTGRPKGVMVAHAGLVNLALAFVETFLLRPGERMLMLHSPAFDASVGDLFPPLVAGAALVVHRAPRTLLGRDFATTCERHEIAVVELAAAFWQQWTEDLAAREQAPPPRLRALVVGGESVGVERVRSWFRLAPGPFRLLNHYGPTEATVCASRLALDRRAGHAAPEVPWPRLPIGTPLPNVRIHLLDADLQPVPLGVAGELMIGGIGVARGYRGRPEATAARFVPDPVAGPDAPGARLYRTGDLARRWPDGKLDFLGRLDAQLKVRGYRVEPGEIETELAAHPAVRAAAVLAADGPAGGRRLVACVLSADGPAGAAAPAAAELRSFLAGRLPAHMLPDAFVWLDRLPVNASGKVDRRALATLATLATTAGAGAQAAATPGGTSPEAAASAAAKAPAGDLEHRIAAVWCELLGIEQVGRHDNFFDAGGHSLLVLRLEARLRDDLGLPLGAADLFRHPTVAAQAVACAGHRSPPSLAPVAAGAPRRSRDGDVAIVGMSGRFPGAGDVDRLWSNLRHGVEAIRFFSLEELRHAGVPEEHLADPTYVRAKGALDGVEDFDPAFFGLSPREAEVLDPQHRLFLECGWEALESAAVDPERHAGLIGVFAAVGRNSYFTSNLLRNQAAVRRVGIMQTVIGNDRDFLPTRLSYKLNLRGPSLAVQTACSSSLVAVHLACRSLLGGECDLALAGGVTISIPQVQGYFYEEGGIFSNDGHCRAFDAKAKGTVPGSGVGVVVLARLDDALAVGATIHAVIRGTAVNNDGSRKIGYTAPGTEGQMEVLREAISRAGVAADSLQYLETHGTGTLLGDLIETSALKDAFRPLTAKTGFCALGSLKTNVGHLDAAAGVAGLIKAALALRHREIPPSLHFRQANPKLDLAGSPFFVITELRPWPANGTPRRAGVSSFGLGGTNAHAILEEAPAPAAAAPGRPSQLLVLSARRPGPLEHMARRLADHLESHPELDLADAAYTLQVGRRGFEQRAAVVCRDGAEAIAALRGGLPQSACDGAAPAVVFLFPGMGSQRPDMGRDLYRHETVFRAALDRNAELLRPFLGADLRPLLFPEPGAEGRAAAELERPSRNMAAAFAVCHALAELWLSWGVQPWAMIGHSLGEYVAATLAGVFPLETATAMVVERGRLFDELPPGGMLSVPLGSAQLEPLLGGGLALGAVNAPNFCAVSGPLGPLAALERSLAARGLECRRLPIAGAPHSPLVEPALGPFGSFVAGLELRPPQRQFVSTVTGTWITAEQATDPAYWVRQLRQTVRFADAVSALRKEPRRLFLEVGPGRTLASLVRAQEGAGGAATLSSLRQADAKQQALAAALSCLGELWRRGVRPDWNGVHAGQRRRRVQLPTYPFARERCWIDPLPEREAAAADPWQRRPDPGDWFWARSWRRQPLGRRTQGSTAAPPEAGGGCLLIFAGAAAAAAPLAARLAGAGQGAMPASALTLTAAAGASFAAAGRDAFVLDPTDPAQLARLWDELRRQGLTPGQLVWWQAAGAHDRCADEALRGLLGLARHLMTLDGQRPPLCLVVAGAFSVHGEAPRPEQAALAGAVRALAGPLSASVLDLGTPPEAPPDPALCVARELLSGTAAGEVAFRGPHRWVHADEPWYLERPPAGRTPGAGAFVLAGDGGETRRRLATALCAAGARVAALDLGPLSAARVATAASSLNNVEGVLYAAAPSAGGAALLSGSAARQGSVDGAMREVAADLEALAPLAAGAGFALAVFTLDAAADPEARAWTAARRELAAAWIEDAAHRHGLPWRGAVLEDLPAPRPGSAPSLSAADLIEVLERAAQLEPGAWVTVSTGDLPGRLSAWQAALASPAGAAAAAAAAAVAAGVPPGAEARHPRPPLATPYMAPRDAVERDLAEIWQDLLGIDRIGVHDNYFDLGGDSVASIQIVARANLAGYKLTQRKAFHHPTIAELARTALLDTRIHAQQSTVEGPVQLIPIQQWFFEQPLADPGHWNLSALLAPQPPLLATPLAAAVDAVVDHHDALRLRFERRPEGWRQVSVAPQPGRSGYACIDLAALPAARRSGALEAAAAAVQESLDLAAGPLARFVLFRRQGSVGDRLLAVIHHLVVDAPSWRILFEDLAAAYDQALRREPPKLPSKTTSFKHWGVTLREHTHAGVRAPEAPYWLDGRRARAASLPIDLPGRNEVRSGAVLTCAQPPAETRLLLQAAARSPLATLEEMLLTALVQALAGWSGRRLWVLDVEGLGRESIHDEVDLSRTVGWFTSPYPLLVDLEAAGTDPRSELEGVRDALRAVPGGGLGYGLLRYLNDDDALPARLRRLPPPELSFVYLGQIQGDDAQEKRWGAAAESAGPQRSPRDPRLRLLSVSTAVLREGLQSTWSYGTNVHRPATIERLAAAFGNHLRRLTAVCLEARGEAFSAAGAPRRLEQTA